jgi:peroxiredoxin
MYTPPPPVTPPQEEQAYYPPDSRLERPPAPAETTCPNCGAPNAGESRFCGYCGYRYGAGRTSQKIMTMSTADRSRMVASSENVMEAPVYAPDAEEYLAEPGEIPGKRRKAAKREKPSKIRTSRRTGERKFPMGLLMAVMVVGALMIALVIYVVSGGPTSTEQITQTEGPVISSVTFTPNSDGTIQVEWTTDLPSTGQVMFCNPEGVCSWTDKVNSLMNEHSVAMTGIQANLEYHITVESIDGEGNTTQFESAQTFTGISVGTGDTEPPVISGVTSTSITDTGFVVKWTTDELATSQVEYGTSNTYGLSTEVNSSLTTSHTVVVTGLDPNNSYFFRAVSADADGNTASDENGSRIITLTTIFEGLEIGNRAPDFSLQDISGNTISLSDYYGKKMVIVNFWATWCVPCVEEMPYLQEVYNNWSSTDRLEILALNKQESAEDIESFLDGSAFTFTVLMDSGNVATDFSVGSIPTTYFIDSQGVIRGIKKDISFGSANEIENILNKMD